ncbi:MAG: GGDEF domain-containing protein, partial [Candidatus Baltobacteraceae bacterium]
MSMLAGRERLRAHLVERRESDFLGAVRDLTAASRESSDAVLASLDRTLRMLEPALDATLVFEPVGGELICLYAGGARALHYNRVRYGCDRKTLLGESFLAGHRVCLAAGRQPLIPTDRAALAIPLGSDRSVSAMVYVASSAVTCLQNVDSLVRAVEQAAAPYELALERERDRSNATYDSLTGLLTPRAFRTRLQDEIGAARLRASPTVSLWFIDTDHFKAVNDTFGHATGDRVLQRMSRILSAHTVAGVDIAARNGGDEFCAIVREAQKTVAIERAQHLCDAVRAHDFGIPLSLSAS